MAGLAALVSSWLTSSQETEKRALVLDVDYLLLAPRLAPRHLLVDAILETPRFENRIWLADLPHDVLLRIFSNLQPASLCRLAQVSKSMQHLTDEDALWRPICGCGRAPSLAIELTCKEHVRDKHLHRLQCEALLWLIRDEENRRRQRARLRKLKQVFLPLLQSVFVLCLLFWPWEEERPHVGAAGGSKEVCYQYAVWDREHALSPTVRAAAS